ncbi:TPA: hypothetical protein ACTZ5Q_005484, partial [Bacillus cereus]
VYFYLPNVNIYKFNDPKEEKRMKMRLFKVIAMIFCFLGFPSVPKIIFMIGNVISTTSIYFKKWDDINKYSIITAMTAIQRKTIMKKCSSCFHYCLPYK